MDENILQAVKDAAISMLRGHEPDVDVYAEEIMRTDRTLEPEDEDGSKWYFVEVIPPHSRLSARTRQKRP